MSKTAASQPPSKSMSSPLSEAGAINSGVIATRMQALTRDAALSILVVDADAIELTLVGDQLESHGFNVVRCSNGEDALTLMVEKRFPVLLTDLQMPGMDGIELTRRVRARGIDDAYILMLTVRDASFDYERGYAAGVDDYLTKKLPDVELHARIHVAFNTSALRRELKEIKAKLAEAERGKAAMAAKLAPLPMSEPAAGDSLATTDDIGGTSMVLDLPVMAPPKVLLVDDDEIMLERLQIPMVEAGYEVVTASDGASALAALQADFMSIVILDRNMPGMDGLELCRRIRQQTWPGYVYLMLLTAHDAEEDVLLGLKAGADDYLSKRVSDAQLVARLSTASRVLSLEHSLKGALDERRRMAMTDALTGAHNRRYFMRYLRGELKRARRFGAELSLLLLDIDFFKKVNDEFGHAAGDMVLQKFVKRVQKGLPRDYDWCARLGGEEFVVVLPQTDLAGAAVVAERLRRLVEEYPLHMSESVRPITVSIGVSGLQALPKRESASIETLLADADRHLYKSKENGRNRVTTASPHVATP
jgi:two-component system cell cycle response regulator